MAPDFEVVESLARILVREAAGEDQLEAARALAAAQLELKRIRAVKVAAMPSRPDQMLDPKVLTELCAIGRYERLALSLRKTARRRLDEIGGATRVTLRPDCFLESQPGSDKGAAQAWVAPDLERLGPGRDGG